MAMFPRYGGRHFDYHVTYRRVQATTRRQRHLSHASPAPGGESSRWAPSRDARGFCRQNCADTCKQQSDGLMHHIQLLCPTFMQHQALHAENRPPWWSARTAPQPPIPRSSQEMRRNSSKTEATMWPIPVAVYGRDSNMSTAGPNECG